MRLVDNVYMVGGGAWGGMGLTPGPDCNVYLVDCGSELVLIDCGSGSAGSCDAILANIAADGLAVDRIGTILLTHKHGDHIGGAAQLAERTGAVLYGSAETAEVLASADEEAASIAAAKQAGLYAQDFVLSPVPGVKVLEEGQHLRVGEVDFEVIDTPGHCSGHISFVVRNGRRVDLMAGDAIFWRGRVVMQTLPDCDVQASGRSIEKLAAIEGLQGLYSGHGAFTIAGAPRHIAAALEHVRALRVPPGL
jgi:glyoxylase-like metal-dependent hydrolase (beta-lactamase superfamily II)